MSSEKSLAGCMNAPVLKERGQHEVFCGLTSIIWLHGKCRMHFFLLLARGPALIYCRVLLGMVFAEPRFGTAILEETDFGWYGRCSARA